MPPGLGDNFQYSNTNSNQFFIPTQNTQQKQQTIQQQQQIFNPSTQPIQQQNLNQTPERLNVFQKKLPKETFSDALNFEENRSDRSNTPDSTGFGEEFIERKKMNLYEKTLRKDSGNNSPSILKSIQGKYFSGVSTPQSNMSDSETIPFTPKNDTSEVTFPGDDSQGGQLTDDMIENFKLEEHVGKLVEFAKTYNGSRVLQKFFPRANQSEIDVIIKEIEESIDDLMLDPYANYMFQTLAQSCSAEQRFKLLEKIAPNMIKIASDKKGTHSLQAIVSLISRECEDKLIKDTLDGHVLKLSFDNQGTHLIQKLINSISVTSIDFIYQPIVDKFTEVANHSSGLCVLKQLMSKVEKIPEYKKQIIGLIFDNLENLIQNPFGNYAIQHALEVYPKDCNAILEKILEKIIQYSNQKFSSNVIEKCIIISSSDYKKRYLAEITKPDRLIELMKNKYGNYVIFKILSQADNEDKQYIMQCLIKCLNNVTVSKYRNRWITFIEENPLKIPNIPNLQLS